MTNFESQNHDVFVCGGDGAPVLNFGPFIPLPVIHAIGSDSLTALASKIDGLLQHNVSMQLKSQSDLAESFLYLTKLDVPKIGGTYAFKGLSFCWGPSPSSPTSHVSDLSGKFICCSTNDQSGMPHHCTGSLRHRVHGGGEGHPRTHHSSRGSASRGTKKSGGWDVAMVLCGLPIFTSREQKNTGGFMQKQSLMLNIICSGHTLMSTLEWKTQAR